MGEAKKKRNPGAFGGKNSHHGERGNGTTHSSSLRKCFTPVKFHRMQRACASRKITMHLCPNTISGSTICAVVLHLAAPAVYLRENKIPATRMHTHSGTTRCRCTKNKKDTKKQTSRGFFYFNLIPKRTLDLFFRVVTLGITKYCSEKL